MASKFDTIIAEGAARLLSRVSVSRGLTVQDVVPRIEQALGKYVFKDNPAATAQEVSEFITELRADELCLVLACEKGDDDAWNDLVRDFDSTVKSTARKIASNPPDADDLASSIWAELHGLRHDADGKIKSKLSYYSGRGSLGGWLRVIVSQLAIDEFRKQSKFVQVEENRELENLADDASRQTDQTIVSQSASPEEELSSKMTATHVLAAIQEAIAMLSADDRLMLKLYYFDDVRLKDIASTFGFHEATASRRLVKIQSTVRDLVEDLLRKEHGWSESEVNRFLSEAATNLGFGIEHMFKMVIFAVVVQEALKHGVL